jgi:hypothetical protein
VFEYKRLLWFDGEKIRFRTTYLLLELFVIFVLNHYLMDIAISKNQVPIRLTDERWHHISLGHPEIADYYYEILEAIENPKIIYAGNYGGLIATSQLIEHINMFIVVIYKEISKDDGFVITAYLSNKVQKFNKKKILWKQ